MNWKGSEKNVSEKKERIQFNTAAERKKDNQRIQKVVLLCPLLLFTFRLISLSLQWRET